MYHTRNNNCEHFTNFCLTGDHQSFQIKNTEVIADILISAAELFLVNGSPSPTILDDFTEFRKLIKIERQKSIDEVINKQLKNKKTMTPPVTTLNSA